MLLAVLLLMLVMGTIASVGWDQLELRNREVWWWTCILMSEAVLMPNVYAALLLGTVIVGLWQIGRSWHVLRSTLIPIAGIAGIYALIAPCMQLWMIPWILWTGVGIGMFLSAWALIGVIVTRRPFRFIIPERFKWWGMWGIYEDLKYCDRFLCGQANRCHICALSAFAMGCAAGLVWMGQWWAAPMGVLCYLPMHVNARAEQLADDKGPIPKRAMRPHIGHLALIAAGLAALSMYEWQIGIPLTVALGAGSVVFVLKSWRKWLSDKWSWLDSGRLVYWTDALLLIWWPAGWRARLFGFGTCTWFMKTFKMGEARHPVLLTAAHNEFLQQMFEHGVVGLAIMVLYVGDALWRTGTGVPAQQAVALLAAMWCAVALVHFPATLYHEFHPIQENKEQWFGSPPLNVWTLMIALLVEAR